MPRILSINNYNYRRGGAEVVFLEQNRLLSEIGWDVALFCMKHDKNLTSEWERFFVDQIEFGQAYSFVEKVKMANKVVFSFEAKSNIGALCEVFKPDVAHAHNVYHHISPSIFGELRSRGIPTVLTLHDLKMACPAYKMLNSNGICELCKGGGLWNVVRHRCVKESVALSSVVMVESVINRLLGSYSSNVDRFVVPSRFYLEKFVEWGWPRDRFVHIPNFVDLSTHIPGNENSGRFVYFGRLGSEKGLRTLILAAAKALVPLTVVGTGPEEVNLKLLALNSGGDVKFLGYQSGEALNEIVRAAVAVVIPSEWYENAPMSVLEAYGLGRPVIGANIGGIPELIRDNETGVIFPSGDVDALTQKLLNFATLSPQRLREMGMAGRDWVKESFTTEEYRSRLSALYADLGAG